MRSPRKRQNQPQPQHQPLFQFPVRFQKYQNASPQQSQQFIAGRNRRGRRTWAQNTNHLNFVSPIRKISKQQKWKLARKSVQKARELLIANRIANNMRSQGQRGGVSSVVERYKDIKRKIGKSYYTN